MSLFKTRDWWSFLPEEHGTLEEYNTGSLLVANITNDDPVHDKITVAGFSGMLRIFNPQITELEDGSKSHGFKPDHLLLEVNLGQPVLQVAAGKFVSGNESLHLCILHSDSFTVHSVNVVKGQTGHGTQIKLNKAYQHTFQRKAYSLTAGNFGSVKERDFIAVHSLDGCISIYEQETFSFVCFLPGFLLPGPLAYLPKSDMIVTQSSDWTLQSYLYQTLSALVRDGLETGSKAGGKRIQPEWTQNMSEVALDIKILVERGNASSIVVLTTHSFLCYKDSGILKFIKKLEYNPSCFTAYHNDKVIHVCIATHTSNLLVYKESELKWAAQLPFVPVAMDRSDFVGIKGALVLLGEMGQLQINYLGTDPSLFTAPPNETREINYENTDKEMAQLNKVIRSSTKDSGSIMNLDKREKDVAISATLASKFETWTGPTRVSDPAGIPCIALVIRLSSQSPINSVRVNIVANKPLAVSQNSFVIGSLSDTSQILVKFYLFDAYIPPSLRTKVVVSYLSAARVPHVISNEIELPLKLVMKPCSASKEADSKITISTNKPAINLTDLFPEFDFDSSSGSALGLQHYSGPTVTVLSSRTSNRYRLQSDSVAALWIVLQALVDRLNSYWSKGHSSSGTDKLTISVTSPIPLNDLYSEIDAHFLRRRNHFELEGQLVQRATQFRAVQRRLLMKFKDRTPTPLTNLDNLLEGTYKQILQITEFINQNMKGLEEDGCQLSCVVHLVLMTIFLQTGVTEEHKALLMGALSPLVYLNVDQGWEEVTNAGVAYALRSLGGRTPGDDGGAYLQTIAGLQDTTKLKKNIGHLVDKVSKGGAVAYQKRREETPEEGIEGPVVAAQKRKEKTLKRRDSLEDNLALQTNGDSMYDEVEEAAVIDGTTVPWGSKLGEDRARSARLRSARIQSARAKFGTAPIIEETQAPIIEENHAPIIEETQAPIIEENHAPIIEGNHGVKVADVENSGRPSTLEIEEGQALPLFSDSPVYEEIEEEPIYAEVPETNEANHASRVIDSEGKAFESRKKSAFRDKTKNGDAIEAPEDIFGNPVDDEDSW